MHRLLLRLILFHYFMFLHSRLKAGSQWSHPNCLVIQMSTDLQNIIIWLCVFLVVLWREVGPAPWISPLHFDMASPGASTMGTEHRWPGSIYGPAWRKQQLEMQWTVSKCVLFFSTLIRINLMNAADRSTCKYTEFIGITITQNETQRKSSQTEFQPIFLVLQGTRWAAGSWACAPLTGSWCYLQKRSNTWSCTRARWWTSWWSAGYDVITEGWGVLLWGNGWLMVHVHISLTIL